MGDLAEDQTGRRMGESIWRIEKEKKGDEIPNVSRPAPRPVSGVFRKGEGFSDST
jgi:hypothetical protein